MEAKCIGSDGTTSNISVSESVFGRDYNETLVHQIITAYMSNARQGTRAQKGRSDVTKSTHKLWRQKGTGRARVGAASNPLWRGGGRIFPSSPMENFAHKVNKKMYRAGICTILSRLLSENRLHLIEEFSVDTPKTKELINKLEALNFKNVLIITEQVNNNLYLSSRNVPMVSVIDALHMDPINLIKHNDILMSREALVKIEEMLK
ncbi:MULTISPECIES: 50S ribosomal protein L4 [Nitrosomonas]|uniref:Large ribosomal subunit protein uL4 n=1 Tax=Nitrosomonas communis TaxID=44574 RepID=A0A0F7KHU7_9PROT|nr:MULTISPECIES: 50S ribosomal protein L4 [Nitrosomonas]AKH39081.1 50S ribosomal protein L4 [Nitrosomonas communis]TYP80148.1 large subunit ribosomal protein L4 [Nitrosomonas communis]UVS61248.1 50S ribosomal protein L4 [Nitrosomonas sp. PLL12]